MKDVNVLKVLSTKNINFHRIFERILLHVTDIFYKRIYGSYTLVYVRTNSTILLQNKLINKQ